MSAYSLDAGRNLVFSISTVPGYKWKISVIPESKTVDFNLYVYDSSGKLIVEDSTTAADAYCTFDSAGDGVYKARVESVKGSSNFSFDINYVGRAGSTSETSDNDSNSGSFMDVVKKDLTESEKTEILNAHNSWRKKYENHGVGSLKWSDELAKYAQEWADKLAKDGFKMIHRSPNKYGENLAWGKNRDLTPTNVVDLWGDEVNSYHYDTNTCDDVCGHYTQVVWKSTHSVGCGMAKGKDGQEIWVCNYDPPGNYVGQKPY